MKKAEVNEKLEAYISTVKHELKRLNVNPVDENVTPHFKEKWCI